MPKIWFHYISRVPFVAVHSLSFTPLVLELATAKGKWLSQKRGIEMGRKNNPHTE